MTSLSRMALLSFVSPIIRCSLHSASSARNDSIFTLLASSRWLRSWSNAMSACCASLNSFVIAMHCDSSDVSLSPNFFSAACRSIWSFSFWLSISRSDCSAPSNFFLPSKTSDFSSSTSLRAYSNSCVKFSSDFSSSSTVCLNFATLAISSVNSLRVFFAASVASCNLLSNVETVAAWWLSICARSRVTISISFRRRANFSDGAFSVGGCQSCLMLAASRLVASCNSFSRVATLPSLNTISA
mmetsp:Transcript_28872/g.61816  ORF Transcript_28872/g.61816 Transcript_28872/m.61816 type:complete len:242 (+) Transcript_28872:2561-3286(+)